MHQPAQARSHGRRQLAKNFRRRPPSHAHLAEPSRQMLSALLAALCWLPDAQSGSQPTPQRRRHQQLRPPPPQTAPFLRIRVTSEPCADRACRLSQHQMPIERFHDDRRRIPPPRVQPIGQSTHGVAAIAAHVPPHPNHYPSRTQAAHLPAITTMPLHPHPSAIPRQLPAPGTESRPKLFHRRCALSSGAEVLDGNGKAV